MGYGATTDKVIAERQIEDYIAASLPEQLSLMQTGLIYEDVAPGFTQDWEKGGNVFQMKGRIRDTGAWAVPVDQTAMGVNAITSWSQKAVVARRLKLYGNQDFASLAGSEGTDAWKADLARIMAHNFGINLEKLYFQYLIKGVFDTTSGVLKDTHLVNNSTAAFEEYMLAEALEKLGENGSVLDTVIMHSSVYWKRRINTLLTETPVPTMSVPDRETQATTYVGNIGRLRLFLNDRVQNTSDAGTTNGVFDTIVGGSGALMFANQLAYGVEIFPRSTEGGGSDRIAYKAAFSVAIPKVSWTGTAASDIAGATDAEIGTATNWTLSTGAAVSDTPLVVIKSKAE